MRHLPLLSQLSSSTLEPPSTQHPGRQLTDQRPHGLLGECGGPLGADGHAQPRGGFFVTPRKGTISPWSSKATDIFRNCGLSSVNRVERGVHFRVLAGERELSVEIRQAVLIILTIVLIIPY